MLFYLLTRGIDPAVAQRLLKWAFITDVVAAIDVPGIARACAAQSRQPHAGRPEPGGFVVMSAITLASRGRRRYDVERVRRDFPILSRTVHGKPLTYLDSARLLAATAAGDPRRR